MIEFILYTNGVGTELVKLYTAVNVLINTEYKHL